MELYEGLLSRRTVRSFTDKKFSEMDIQALLKAAMFSPSSCNSRPWSSFIVFTKPADLQLLSDIHPHTKMVKDSAFAILIMGNDSAMPYPEFLPQDLSNAAYSLLLAAHAKGLGGVWCGVYPNETYIKDFREHLKLPADQIPFALLAFGEPKDALSQPNRFDPSRVTFY